MERVQFRGLGRSENLAFYFFNLKYDFCLLTFAKLHSSAYNRG
jgi:hypothetical protein